MLTSKRFSPMNTCWPRFCSHSVHSSRHSFSRFRRRLQSNLKQSLTGATVITLSSLSSTRSQTTKYSCVTSRSSLSSRPLFATTNQCAALLNNSTTHSPRFTCERSLHSRTEQKAFRIPKPVCTRWSYIHRTLSSFNENIEAVFAPASTAYQLHRRNHDRIPGLDILLKLFKPQVNRLFSQVCDLLSHFEQGLRHLEGIDLSPAPFSLTLIGDTYPTLSLVQFVGHELLMRTTAARDEEKTRREQSTYVPLYLNISFDSLRLGL